jgi:hypothetical protein
VTEQLHRLIDSKADQPVINERIAGLMEATRQSTADLAKVCGDHEKRIRYLERILGLGLGALGLLSMGISLWGKLK